MLRRRSHFTYVFIPLAFGGFIWARFGADRDTVYLAGYVVGKSLSVDNLHQSRDNNAYATLPSRTATAAPR